MSKVSCLSKKEGEDQEGVFRLAFYLGEKETKVRGLFGWQLWVEKGAKISRRKVAKVERKKERKENGERVGV